MHKINKMGGVLLLLSKISFYSVTLILIILIGVLSFKIDKKTEKKFDNDVKNEYIASYIDGEYQNEIPGKDDGYFVDKVVCDNGATATWDNDEWGINIRNATQKVKCSIYFKEDTFGNAVKAKLDNTGKCPTINGDSVVINSETLSDYLVCSAPDNYGTSYYFRGPMSGNYAKVADITDGGDQYGSGGGGVNIYNGGVKPVINIKQGSIVKGTGSIDSPYEVE